MDFPPQIKARTSTKFGMSATLGDDAGGGRTIMELTVTMAAREFTAVHGARTVVGIAAGTAGK